MFGERIDYWLLCPLTHRCNRATEEELNLRASTCEELDVVAAKSRLLKWNARLDGRIPISSELRYLDIGCGHGDLTLAFALAGCGHVTGIDITPRNIERARIHSEQLGLGDRIRFECVDVHRWQPSRLFDVALSHEVMEHMPEPRRFLERLWQLMTPGGVAVFAFGPLFHSPFGDHMHGFFRVPIPWRGVLFSERAILRLRREQFRPGDTANTYQQILGGLNLLRYSEFLRDVAEVGWETEALFVNPQLRQYRPLGWLSDFLVRVPLVQDFFAASVYAILRRPGRQEADPVAATVSSDSPSAD